MLGVLECEAHLLLMQLQVANVTSCGVCRVPSVRAQSTSPGKCWLVGSGPGGTEHLTVSAVKGMHRMLLISLLTHVSAVAAQGCQAYQAGSGHSVR